MAKKDMFASLTLRRPITDIVKTYRIMHRQVTQLFKSAKRCSLEPRSLLAMNRKLCIEFMVASKLGRILAQVSRTSKQNRVRS